MNNKETYEIIIAQKLEQLPVPAMEDAIWNRISAQLDIEMPETPAQQPSPSPNNTFLNIATLFVLITAIATYLFVQKQPAAPQPVIPTPVQVRDSIRPSETIPLQPSPPKTPTPKTIITTPDTVTDINVIPVVPVISDSLTIAPPETVVTPPAIITPVDTVRKKPAGVKGLRDEDYKIAPKH
jgi:hypothetical protein